MRSTMMMFVSFVALLLPVAGCAQPPTWNLEARISVTALVGEIELGKAAATKGEAAADAMAASAIVTVPRNSTFQISVTIIDPAGKRQTVTGSPKLIYRSDGCLTISASGFATATPSGSGTLSCVTGENAPLTIIYRDPTTKVVAMNMYMLRIE